MPSTAVSGPDFEDMLRTVEILRGHYSKIVAKADTLAFRLHSRNDMSGFREVRETRMKMRTNHDKALDLIAEELTSPAQLQATRNALKQAKQDAHRFVRKLQQTTMTLNNLRDAAGFLSALVTNLTGILR